jgi:DNA-binding CsgD family transcriptional regulator
MRSAIAWSVDLLNPLDHLLFGRLAVFVGGFELRTAEATCKLLSGDEPPVSEVDRMSSPVFRLPTSYPMVDVIQSLHDNSLLRQVDGRSDEEPRYRMLETVREFGLERLEASGEAAAVRWAHAQVYARLAAKAEPALTGPDQMAWFTRLEAEHDNLRAALTWAIDHDPETGLRMAGGLIRFWDHHSHVREGQRWLEATLSTTGELLPLLRAKALWGVGVLAIGTGDYARAERSLIESLNLARAAGDPYWIGFALNGLGSVALHHGDLDHAFELHEEGLARLREADDADGIAALLGNLAYDALVRGAHDQAVVRAEESLVRFRALASAHGTASMLGTLGRALLAYGNDERAAGVLGEGLVLSRELGNKWYTITTLEGLAGVAATRGQAERAARLFGAVDGFVEDSGLALHPYDRATNRRYADALRTQLGEGLFGAAWDAGRAMPLEQVIAGALDLADPTASPNRSAAPPTTSLTAREVEVLRHLAKGLSDRAIADALSISPRTVNGHVTNVLAKLGLDSRTAAATYAIRHGLA